MNAKPEDTQGEGASLAQSSEASQAEGSSEFDALLKASGSPRTREPELAPAPDRTEATTEATETPHVIEADVDGKRVRIVAQDEIVLQCGDASITLRRNGRIVIKGTYIETCSEGTNRIKGGQVRIN
jgi:hypothetical protein